MHALQSCFLKIHFKITYHLPLPFSSVLFLLRRPTKTLYVDQFLSLVLALFCTYPVPKDKPKFEVSEVLRNTFKFLRWGVVRPSPDPELQEHPYLLSAKACSIYRQLTFSICKRTSVSSSGWRSMSPWEIPICSGKTVLSFPYYAADTIPLRSLTKVTHKTPDTRRSTLIEISWQNGYIY